LLFSDSMCINRQKSAHLQNLSSSESKTPALPILNSLPFDYNWTPIPSVLTKVRRLWCLIIKQWSFLSLLEKTPQYLHLDNITGNCLLCFKNSCYKDSSLLNASEFKTCKILSRWESKEIMFWLFRMPSVPN
jgi:hypothetical protein